MGAGKTQRVGRKSKDSWREEGGVSCTIMGKGRPGCGALVSNNDSHVVLFISAIQESIEGSFFISTLSMQLPPHPLHPFPLPAIKRERGRSLTTSPPPKKKQLERTERAAQSTSVLFGLNVSGFSVITQN